jgi:hypothetical protein
MEVSGQLHAAGRFTSSEKAPGTHSIGGWVGPRAVLDAVVKSQKHCYRYNNNTNNNNNNIFGTLMCSPQVFNYSINSCPSQFNPIHITKINHPQNHFHIIFSFTSVSVSRKHFTWSFPAKILCLCLVSSFLLYALSYLRPLGFAILKCQMKKMWYYYYYYYYYYY